MSLSFPQFQTRVRDGYWEYMYPPQTHTQTYLECRKLFYTSLLLLFFFFFFFKKIEPQTLHISLKVWLHSLLLSLFLHHSHRSSYKRMYDKGKNTNIVCILFCHQKGQTMRRMSLSLPPSLPSSPPPSPHYHRQRSSLSLFNWSYSHRFTMRIVLMTRKNFIFYSKIIIHCGDGRGYPNLSGMGMNSISHVHWTWVE